MSSTVSITSTENTVVIQSQDRFITIESGSTPNNLLVVTEQPNRVEVTNITQVIENVTQDVTVEVFEPTDSVVAIELRPPTTVTIPETRTNVITVATPGPAGPPGVLPDSGEFTFNGDWIISGSLLVHGQTILTQTSSLDPALIVSGAMEMVRAQLASEIVSASLSIQNLGTLGDRNDDNIVDLGGFF